MFSQQVQGQRAFLSQGGPEYEATFVSCKQPRVVSKQLWFEKIRRAVEWGKVLMRRQSPAGSATLPPAGHQGEDT